MSYRSPQASAVITGVQSIPVIGGILASLLPSDIGNDWTTANAIIEAWIAKQYRTRISRTRTVALSRWLRQQRLRRGI